MKHENLYCINRNHGRVDAPVRFCPDCGQVVNDVVSTKHCQEGAHDQSRRTGNRYCADCGKMLRAE